jgi:predicted lipid-binding transport protein (Tim44 family)
MKTLLAAFIALIGLALVVPEADARRMGGGRNVGAQRQAVNPQQPKPPAQQKATQNAPAQQQQAAAPGAAAGQQASGASRWLGPLAGLALGAGLFALFMNNGIAGVLAGLLLLAAFAAAAYFLVRMLRSRAAEQQPLRYATSAAYGSQAATREPVLMPGGAGADARSALSVAQATRWPVDFDEAQFLRHARLNFVRLQAGHDRKDLSTIRDFLTPEVYREIAADVRADGSITHTTEVLTLEAEVLDVATEDRLYIVTVRFSGMIREDGAEAQPFTELWHLQKPVTGRSGWLVSGIQQV